MRRDMPRYSQYLDVKNEFWRIRSCGIVALKMVLEYWYSKGELKQAPPSIPELNRVGHEVGAYIRNIGWSHTGLARLAWRFGLQAENFDWFTLAPDAAFRKFKPIVRRGPVIASVYRYPKRTEGGHLIVVTDISHDSIHLLDPASKTRSGIARTLSRRAFLAAWKRRGVIVGPRLRKTKK